MNVDNPNQVQASEEFTETIMAKLADKKGVHAETAISAVSRFASMSGRSISTFPRGIRRSWG